MGSCPENKVSTTAAPITTTRAPSSASPSLYVRPVATARLELVKNSGVPPTTCTPWSMLPATLISLAFSHSSGPTCLASGSASRSASACATVIFLRARTSAESGPKLKLGHFWIWNTFAPSWPMVLLSERCRPSSSAIMATTVKTPITMPRSVRKERSLCPESVASARRRSSVRACTPRERRSRHAGRNAAGVAPGRTASLIAQRLDRVQEGRGERRPDPEDGAQQDRPQAAPDHHLGIDARRERREHVDELARARPQRHAHEAAHHRHHDGLAEELQQDGRPPRPERAAHADLAGALLHRDEQDVHDADPAHDGGDDADQDARHVERQRHLVEPLQELVLPVHREVVLLVRPEPPRVAHHRDDLVLGLGHLAGGGDHRQHQPALQPERPGEGGERDEHAQVLRLTESVSLAHEGADDRAAGRGPHLQPLSERLLP